MYTFFKNTLEQLSIKNDYKSASLMNLLLASYCQLIKQNNQSAIFRNNLTTVIKIQ